MPSLTSLPNDLPREDRIYTDPTSSLDLEYIFQRRNIDDAPAALSAAPADGAKVALDGDSGQRTRLVQVSSLYGPGNIGCWLCILGSVLVSWTLNPGCRSKDIITNDFMAALALPTVASGHAIYRLVFAQLHPPRGSDEATQYAAAIEAPFNVCETFTVVASALFTIAALQKHRMRALYVLVVGLLCFSMGSLVFFCAPETTRVQLSNLSRPYLFNFQEMMICAFMFLGSSMVLMIAAASLSRHQQINAVTAIERSGTRVAMGKVLQLLLKLWPFVVVFIFPLHALVATGVFGTTVLMDSADWLSRISFFMPKSNHILLDLDQAVALAMGVIALFFSLRDAHESRKLRTDNRPAPIPAPVELSQLNFLA